MFLRCVLLACFVNILLDFLDGILRRRIVFLLFVSLERFDCIPFCVLLGLYSIVFLFRLVILRLHLFGADASVEFAVGEFAGFFLYVRNFFLLISKLFSPPGGGVWGGSSSFTCYELVN